MSPHSLTDVFMKLRSQAALVEPHLAIMDIPLLEGRLDEFPENRNFAYCTVEDNPHIVVSPRIHGQPTARIIALLAHEFGHAIYTLVGRQHTEREADALAEQVFGIQIFYDQELVQTIGPGERPRPNHLPR